MFGNWKTWSGRFSEIGSALQRGILEGLGASVCDPDKMEEFMAGVQGELVQAANEIGRRQGRRVIAIETLPSYPAIGQVFNLTIIEPFTGLEMVCSDGFTGYWRFTGQEITAPVTKQFKLVRVGYKANFDSLKLALAKHGKIPQGQWRKAFKKAFPKPDGKGPIGVADASWVGSSGAFGFPFVRNNGREDFRSTSYVVLADCRWLVEIE